MPDTEKGEQKPALKQKLILACGFALIFGILACGLVWVLSYKYRFTNFSTWEIFVAELPRLALCSVIGITCSYIVDYLFKVFGIYEKRDRS